MGESAAELRRDIEETRAGLGDTLEAIGDRVSPSRIVERRKNLMTGGLRSARERVMGVATEKGQAMHASTTGAIEGAQEVPTMLRHQAQGNPLTAGAIAFGVGFLLAAALPSSQTEQEASGQLLAKAQPLTDEISRSGHELLDHLKQPVQDAVEEVKSAAGESAQAVTETAKEAVKQNTDDIKTATEHVRSEATSSTEN